MNRYQKAARNLLHEWQKDHHLENVPCAVHHLMDTPEQIKYNTEHYEMWGHNLDGTFEYGKYVICCTKADHVKIHAAAEPGKYGHEVSEETRKKLSERFKGEDNPQYGRRGELAACYGRTGDKHPMFGKTHTEEARNKIGEASKKRHAACRLLFNVYTENGGKLKYIEFRRAIKNGDITFKVQPTTIYVNKEN